MKKFIVLFLLCFSMDAYAKFIHPLDFKNTEEEKQQVISYIKERVNKDYCEQLEICDPSTAKLMM